MKQANDTQLATSPSSRKANGPSTVGAVARQLVADGILPASLRPTPARSDAYLPDAPAALISRSRESATDTLATDALIPVVRARPAGAGSASDERENVSSNALVKGSSSCAGTVAPASAGWIGELRERNSEADEQTTRVQTSGQAAVQFLKQLVLYFPSARDGRAWDEEDTNAYGRQIAGLTPPQYRVLFDDLRDRFTYRPSPAEVRSARLALFGEHPEDHAAREADAAAKAEEQAAKERERERTYWGDGRKDALATRRQWEEQCQRDAERKERLSRLALPAPEGATLAPTEGRAYFQSLGKALRLTRRPSMTLSADDSHVPPDEDAPSVILENVLFYESENTETHE